MATLNVSLPDPMKDWVETQVKTGHYSNASDYVRDLIRRTRSPKMSATHGSKRFLPASRAERPGGRSRRSGGM